MAQEYMRRDLEIARPAEHYGMSNGSPVTDAGVVRAGTGFEGWLSDIVSWGENVGKDITGAVTEATGISQEEQLRALEQGGVAVAGSVLYQGGTSPQVVTQSSNVRYPGLPPGAVPIPASFDATLRRYGLSTQMLVYGGAVTLGVIALIMLWPKKKKAIQPVYIERTLPGTGTGMPVVANPCHRKKRNRRK